MSRCASGCVIVGEHLADCAGVDDEGRSCRGCLPCPSEVLGETPVRSQDASRVDRSPVRGRGTVDVLTPGVRWRWPPIARFPVPVPGVSGDGR